MCVVPPAPEHSQTALLTSESIGGTCHCPAEVLVRVWHIQPSHLDDAARREPRSVEVDDDEKIRQTRKDNCWKPKRHRKRHPQSPFCYLYALICIHNTYVDVRRRTHCERPLTLYRSDDSRFQSGTPPNAFKTHRESQESLGAVEGEMRAGAPNLPETNGDMPVMVYGAVIMTYSRLTRSMQDSASQPPTLGPSRPIYGPRVRL